MKRIVCFLLTVAVAVSLCASSRAAESLPTSGSLHLDAKGAVLMEASTGTVLYEDCSEQALAPASVTKVMTMLLVMEALQARSIREEDLVSASENACSYGGTQIYLEPSEEMSVRDLLKAVCVNSANDAAVALAEYVAGSEDAFVSRMNGRARDLGAVNTNFVNPCGLDDEAHYTCAYDVALFTRELLKHPHVLDYTGIWMDSLRNGGFSLANTNKLLRTYTGLTGMKTGYTQKAGHCLSATATRGETTLIAVVLGGETGKGRFASAAALLDYGFGNFTCVTRSAGALSPVPVIKGTKQSVSVGVTEEYTAVLPKTDTQALTVDVQVEPSLRAPVKSGQQVGTARFLLDGKEVCRVAVVALETVERAGFFYYLAHLAERLF